MATVGIDLGTTFCAVAHLDDRGRPATVPNRDGEILTPSAVYLAEDGTAVVGQPALDMALEQPDRVATLMKRRIGLPDFGLLRQVLLGSELLCTVSDALAEALIAQNVDGTRLAAEGRVARAGRNVFFARTEVFDAEGNLIAFGASTHRYRAGSADPAGVPAAD